MAVGAIDRPAARRVLCTFRLTSKRIRAPIAIGWRRQLNGQRCRAPRDKSASLTRDPAPFLTPPALLPEAAFSLLLLSPGTFFFFLYALALHPPSQPSMSRGFSYASVVVFLPFCSLSGLHKCRSSPLRPSPGCKVTIVGLFFLSRDSPAPRAERHIVQPWRFAK